MKGLDQEISRLERLLELPMQDYPKLTEELLYLLPESKVDATPAFQRRRNNELERCNSISDGGEGVSYGRDDTESEDVLRAMGQSRDSRLNTHPPLGKRFGTHESVPESAFKKLRRLSRSLSIGPGSHFKSKMRGIKSGNPGKSERSQSKDSESVDADDVSLACSSPPMSPADFERETDKARFATLLEEELAGNTEFLVERERAMNLHENGDRNRSRSFSASGDHEHVPTIDKITQTSFTESPLNLKKRLSQAVYHVDKLEVIELEENPGRSFRQPDSPTQYQLKFNNQPNFMINETEKAKTESCTTEKAAAAVSGARGGNQCLSPSVTEEVKTPNLMRPDSFPEKLNSLSSNSLSPDSHSPYLRKGIAVHFSPFNEVRFVNKADTSDTFFQEATDPLSAATCHNAPSLHLSDNSACSNGQSHTSKYSHVTPNTQSNSLTEKRPTAGNCVSANGESAPLLPNNNVGRSSFRNAQSVIESERRKRIRKLQHDLQRIQRELQDLDDLEYDITEV